MSTSQKSGHPGRHRTEDLPVRRWLQLGAASAGMGAALIGWSLIGSEVGVAGADSGVASSSAGSAASPSKGVKTPGTTQRSAAAGASLSAHASQSPPVVTAGRDSLGTLSKFLTTAIKEGLNRKTLLNPVQRLDDLTPKHKGLLDLIPRIPVANHQTPWAKEIQERNEENQRRTDAKSRQIHVIVQKGVRLTARDGTPVYTIDGKNFVKYSRVFANGPLESRLITLSDQLSERNRDIVIRNNLKLDPATVRQLWGK